MVGDGEWVELRWLGVGRVNGDWGGLGGCKGLVSALVLCKRIGVSPQSSSILQTSVL